MKLDRIAEALVIVFALASACGCSRAQSGPRAAVSSTTLTSAAENGPKPKVGKVQRSDARRDEGTTTLRSPKDEAPRSRDGERRDASHGFGTGK